MSNLTDTRSAQTTPPGDAFSPGVIVLDEAGVVQACTQSAAAIWDVASDELRGEAFARLFEFEVDSGDEEWLVQQWSALRDSSWQRDTTVIARAYHGGTRTVILRVEPIDGLDQRLIATLTPVPAEKTAPAVLDEGLTLLTADRGIGFFDINPRAGNAHYSTAWKRTLGYTATELDESYATWLALIHPEDSAAAPDQLGRQATAGAHPFSVEFRMRHQRGHFIWIHCLGTRLVGESGQVLRVVGFIIDITERKEIEEGSLANDERLQRLSNSGPLGAFDLDFSAREFWYSPAWATLLGHGPAQPPPGSETFHLAIPAAESAIGLEGWWLSRSPGRSSWCEVVKLQRKDGSPITLLLGAERQLTRKHDLARVTGFVCPLPDDIGVSGDAFASPMVSETLNTLAEAVLVADAQGRVSYLNACAERLLRTNLADAAGRPASDIIRLLDRQTGLPGDDVCERAGSAGGLRPLGNEHLLDLGPDETPIPIAWSSRIFFGPSGLAQGVIVVFRNPEEMTLTPEELLKANRFETLGLLAGGIAHDFNNLLTTILGGISLAKDNRDDSALLDSEQACITAKGLAKQLLGVARGGSGTLSISTPVEIIRDSVKIGAAGSATKIEVHAPHDTWPVHVDRSQILQVFQNLIVNAIQAMPPAPHRGMITINTANVTLDEGQITSLAAGDYVQFEIIDNAAGIKPEDLPSIFDPFFSTKKHGTGLGLATVLSVVRKHGGEVGVNSIVGTGSTFTVFLPRADKPAEVQARRAPTLRFGTGRILFMDDDLKICALTSTMLQSLDYKFDIAHNGEEAIKLYQRYLNIGRPYDAVIMDITVIGGMGGEECFRILHGLDPDVRAIVSSGYDHDDVAQRYLDMGFCGYLAKPYRITDLGKVLRTVLG